MLQGALAAPKLAAGIYSANFARLQVNTLDVQRTASQVSRLEFTIIQLKHSKIGALCSVVLAFL